MKTVNTTHSYTPLENPCQLTEHQWENGVHPLVSICCMTYNHEEYIEQCLQGFLMQQTTFPVEILVHDDASTDFTKDILQHFRDCFPGSIHLIMQKENMWSRGKTILTEYLFKRARGSFLALCHGDDYWISPEKLESQIGQMEKFGVAISGHPARVINCDGSRTHKQTGFLASECKVLDISTVLENNGNVLPFGSIILRRSAAELCIRHMPPVRFHTGIQILGGFSSGILVLPETLSVYRRDVPGSTTRILLGDSRNRIITSILRIDSFLTLKGLYGRGRRCEFNSLIRSQVEKILEGSRAIKIFFLIVIEKRVSSKAKLLAWVFLGYCKRFQKKAFMFARGVWLCI